MFLEDTFYYYKLTDYLIHQQGFDIVFIDNRQTEVWLQRTKRKQNHVIRLTNQEFDWKNQLKIDVDRTYTNAKKLAKLFLGRNIELHNVYVAKHAPVDDWESLNETKKINQGKFTNMHVYYLNDENRSDEKERLFQETSVEPIEFNLPRDVLDMERITQYLKVSILGEFQQIQNTSTKIFEYAKPFYTYVLLVINVLMFLLLEWQGGSTSTETLIRYGAKYNPAILDGEWWRIVSSMFLHIGFLHLVMNMFALHIVGSLVERIYGVKRFLFIYFGSGILGGITSFAFSPQLAAGASGAIFGLFGALLFFGLHYRRIFFQTMGWNIIVIIAFNIIFGFVVQQIDNGAHIGGLVGGFIASGIAFFPKKKLIKQQSMAIFGYIIIITTLLIYGILHTSTHYDPALEVQIAQQLIVGEEYDEVITVTTRIIKSNPSDYSAELLFLRSYAYSKLAQTDKARKDLENLISIEPNKIPEAHYNLALIYMDNDEANKAKKSLEKAMDLDSTNKLFTDLYQDWFSNE
ncbi:rhomboid family intramembrane serine protease [Paraliobacillus zengyii]|uniref:rhomboid family intramembrane serine protease n=1 Tax=Paraliobacillus zengyii TaxID=2213194 RepID=UPI0013A6C814|nr:rhomboid family intramembrane serine protease [Paraliobacillus zengyii]